MHQISGHIRHLFDVPGHRAFYSTPKHALKLRYRNSILRNYFWAQSQGAAAQSAIHTMILLLAKQGLALSCGSMSARHAWNRRSRTLSNQHPNAFHPPA